MKSISTFVAVFTLSIGLGALAPVGVQANPDITSQGILGLGNDVVQQSAPGCARNPPPSQC